MDNAKPLPVFKLKTHELLLIRELLADAKSKIRPGELQSSFSELYDILDEYIANLFSDLTKD